MKKILLSTFAIFGFAFSANAMGAFQHNAVVSQMVVGARIFDSNGFIVGRVADTTSLSTGSDKVFIFQGTDLKNGQFGFRSISEFDIKNNHLHLKTK